MLFGMPRRRTSSSPILQVATPSARPIGMYVPPPPLLRTPDGIPDGWHVWVGVDGVPVLERKRG